jgi:hypothetical protein
MVRLGNVSSGAAVSAPASEEMERRFGRSDPFGRPLMNGRYGASPHSAYVCLPAFLRRNKLIGKGSSGLEIPRCQADDEWPVFAHFFRLRERSRTAAQGRGR